MPGPCAQTGLIIVPGISYQPVVDGYPVGGSVCGGVGDGIGEGTGTGVGDGFGIGALEPRLLLPVSIDLNPDVQLLKNKTRIQMKPSETAARKVRLNCVINARKYDAPCSLKTINTIDTA